MEEKKEKEESLTKQLYHFAGSYKYLSILSTILAAISAFVALVPFYYIWKVMQEVLRVRFDFSLASKPAELCLADLRSKRVLSPSNNPRHIGCKNHL